MKIIYKDKFCKLTMYNPIDLHNLTNDVKSTMSNLFRPTFV